MIKKRLTAFCTALLLLAAFAGFNAFAYDVDFSIKPQEASVKQGDSITVNIVVTTQEKGYTEFEMQLLYEESVFSCESTYNENGYVGSGKNGAYTLIYKDPSIDEPSPTKKNDVFTIPVKFTVLSDATVGNTKFTGSVITCNGIDNLDLNSPVKLELAQLLSKTVTVAEASGADGETDDSDSEGTADSADPNANSGDNLDGLIEQPKLPSNEKSSYNWIEIVGIIIGGIIVFFSGCVVGYLFKQKKGDVFASGGDYYSPGRRGRSSRNDNGVDISRSSDHSGFNGASRNISEPQTGNNSFADSTASAQAANQQSYSPPTANIAGERTASGYTSSAEGTYSAGYRQPPMQTSYATGALQTSARVNQNSPDSPFSAVAPKTYTPGGNYGAPVNRQSQSYAQASQNTYTPTARPAVSFGVQGVGASATGNTASNPIEMAYRGEGTVGSYSPTPLLRAELTHPLILSFQRDKQALRLTPQQQAISLRLPKINSKILKPNIQSDVRATETPPLLNPIRDLAPTNRLALTSGRQVTHSLRQIHKTAL